MCLRVASSRFQPSAPTPRPKGPCSYAHPSAPPSLLHRRSRTHLTCLVHHTCGGPGRLWCTWSARPGYRPFLALHLSLAGPTATGGRSLVRGRGVPRPHRGSLPARARPSAYAGPGSPVRPIGANSRTNPTFTVAIPQAFPASEGGPAVLKLARTPVRPPQLAPCLKVRAPRAAGPALPAFGLTAPSSVTSGSLLGMARSHSARADRNSAYPDASAPGCAWLFA